MVFFGTRVAYQRTRQTELILGDRMPYRFDHPYFSAIILILLIFTSTSCAGGNRFLTIQNGAERPFLPLTSAVDGKYLPNATARFLPIPPRPGASSLGLLPLTHVPAKRQIAGKGAQNTVPPPIVRRNLSSRATRVLGGGSVPVAKTVPAALTALGPLDHIWPIDARVESRVTSTFGWRSDPFTGKRQFHGAVDIAAADGSALVATAPARVHAVGEHPRLGHYVMLAYADASISTYGHLKDYRVRTGQLVARGETIGRVGSSGRSTGPHVDFRLEIDGRRIDPLPLFFGPFTMAEN